MEGDYHTGYVIQENSLPSKEGIDVRSSAASNTCDTDAADDESVVDDSSSDEGGFLEISSDTVNKMKVADLWYELKVRGLLLRGEKSNLVSRLHQSMVDCVVLVGVTKRDKMNTTASDTVMAAFTPGSYWEDLSPEIEDITEPSNPFQACSPTVPEDNHFHTPNKYIFDVTFDSEDFTGETRDPKKTMRRTGCERKLWKSKI